MSSKIKETTEPLAEVALIVEKNIVNTILTLKAINTPQLMKYKQDIPIS